MRYNVNPALHAAMKPYAAPWPDNRYIGEIMFHLAYKDLETVQRVEDRFAIHGVQSVLVPYKKNATESFMTEHLVYIFADFLVLSVVIGLCGLAIIQLRAVKERAKQLAMMRCIGIFGRLIQQFYLIEGTAIGWMGLISGAVTVLFNLLPLRQALRLTPIDAIRSADQ